jgi:integrase/recombinase XerD
MQATSRAQDALAEEQLDTFLAAVNERTPTGQRNLALLLVMADAGLRVAEACALQTTDLVMEAGQLTHLRIRAGKGGKPGQVALTQRAAVKLARWLQTREARGRAVFCTISAGQATGYAAGQELRPGQAVSPRYVRQMVGRLAKRAGLEGRVTPHTLRHTFATRLLRATGNLEVTRKALRHARVQTTAGTYAHLVQEDVDRGIRQLPGNGQEPGEGLQAQIAALRVQLEALTAQVGGEVS